MLQPREMMNVKIKKIFIFIAHLLKKKTFIARTYIIKNIIT